MPADYQSAAAALSIPPTPSPRASRTSSPVPRSPTDSFTSGRVPPWIRPSSTSTRRLSTRRPFSINSSQPQPWTRRVLQTANALALRALQLFMSLTPLQRVLAVTAAIVFFVLGVVALVFSHRIFAALGPVAKSWRDLPGGWVLVWLMVFVTAFPPIIGYSSSVTIAGFVFGIARGWPIVASANVAGSLAAFVASRTIFASYVNRLVGHDKRFVAFGQVLRRDGLGVLTMIRFCPLPYSLSNGFLATIPSVSPWSFAASTALASPKLLVHVFIGSRLALLAEKGDTMTGLDKALNYISMAVFGIIGFTVGVVIYRRTMARAEELSREGDDDTVVDYDDDLNEEEQVMLGSNGMVDPDAAALAMDDDDISLWETDGVEGGYRDSWDEEAAVGSKGGMLSNGNGATNGAQKK